MKTFLTIMILVIFVAAAQGQTAYKGITPGKSTKADVDRILGAPVKTVSPVLVEYSPQPLSTKIYVQYNSGYGVVERIEVLCQLATTNCLDFARSNKLNVTVPDSPTVSANNQRKTGEKMVVSFGPPSYLAVTYDDATSFAGDVPVPVRIALYSADLHRASAESNAAIEASCGADKTPKEYDEPQGVSSTIEGCVQAKKGGRLLDARHSGDD